MIKRKKKNPTDKYFLSKISVDKIVFNNNYEYDVYFGSKFIAYVIIKFNSNSIYKIEILDPQYRRRGLATFLYDHIENDLNITFNQDSYFETNIMQLRHGKLLYIPNRFSFYQPFSILHRLKLILRGTTSRLVILI